MLTRRRALLTSVSAVLIASGCQTNSTEEIAPAPPRQDVPLRVAMFGTEQDAEVLTRGWASVMSQPLKIETLKVDRAATAGIASRITELAEQSDVVIYPIIAMAELVADDAIVPIQTAEFAATEQELGPVATTMRNGAAMYGGNLVATPLGAQVPALLVTEAIDPIETWADYESWVSDLDGAAAEPLAPGWAAIAYLWRAASTLESGWLFSGDDLTPLVDSEPYVQILQQMKQTAEKYKPGRLTPSEIWSQIQSGKLKGGIGFQVGNENEAQVSVSNIPGAASTNRVLLDPFSPVISISAACRQTAASKQFANWLSGGEGSESVRRQIPAMTTTRTRRIAAGDSNQQQGSAYQQWLSKRLTTPVTLPALQLLAAGEYYAALDQQIGLCLDGTTGPAEALTAVATRWRELTDSIGVEKQERAWRRRRECESSRE